MRRKRLRISVTLAVLLFGLLVGWIAGERVPSPPQGDAWAQQQATVESEGTDSRVQPGLDRVSAFRMPYFSFKALVRSTPASTGQQP